MFFHIYRNGEWGIPILPREDGPRLRLNQTVSEMSWEEAIVGIYLSRTLRIVTGGPCLCTLELVAHSP